MNSSTNIYDQIENVTSAIHSISEKTTYDTITIGVFISDFASPFVDEVVTFVVYTCIFLIGLVFNVIVCVVIACQKSMYTTTSCYILNLSISDLLLLIVGAPDKAYESIFNFSRLSNSGLGCFFRTWTAETSASVSTMIVTAFTVERYIAVCHPFVAHVMSDLSRVVKIIVLIWIISLLSSIPLANRSYFLLYPLDDGSKTGSCLLDLTNTSHLMDISTVIFFIVPMTVITVMHILIGIKLLKAVRARRIGRQIRIHATDSTNKTLKLLVAIVVAFFVCWAPVHIQRWMYIYNLDFYGKNYWFDSLLPFYARIFCLLSSVINPVIYSIMSKKFRNAFMDLFVSSVCTKKHCRYKVNSNVTGSGTGNTSTGRTTLANVDS